MFIFLHSFLLDYLNGNSSFSERHKLITKKVCETPVHKQVSSRLLYRQKMGRYVLFTNSLPLLIYWGIYSHSFKIFVALSAIANYCKLRIFVYCFWLFFRRSVPTEDCIVEESPVKPAEGIFLLKPELFVIFPSHKISTCECMNYNPYLSCLWVHKNSRCCLLKWSNQR